MTTSIQPIVCAGTPREIGRQQGAALAPVVARSYQVLAELEALRLVKSRWLPFGLFRRIAGWKAAKLWNGRLGSAAPDMAERIVGIAEGAGVRTEAVQLLNVLEPMLSDLADQTVVPSLGGCSALAVSGERSAAGEPVVARNFDYLPLIQPFYTMREVRPAGAMRSLEFTVAPLAGAVDGVNEAGLCITNNYAYVTDCPSYDRTITMAVSAALGRCSSVDEAIEYLSGTPRWGGALLMLADASGAIASLELSNTRARVRRSDGVLFHTNRFQTAEMREVELPRAATFTRRAPTPLRGSVVHDSAERRWERFEALVPHDGQLAVKELARVLSDHGAAGVPSKDTICMHSDYWFTTATLQLLPRSRRIRVAFDSACRAELVELELTRGTRGSPLAAPAAASPERGPA